MVDSSTILFTIASFIANFGVSVTGFGMALIFLFVYTIGDAIGLLSDCSQCDIKDAIFIQTISLSAVIPLLLYNSRTIIRKYSNKQLLLAFIPSTIIGTPIGQILQDVLQSELIRIIVGALVLLISSYEIFRIRKINNNKIREESPNKASTETIEIETGDSSGASAINPDSCHLTSGSMNKEQCESNKNVDMEEETQPLPTSFRELFLMNTRAVDDDDNVSYCDCDSQDESQNSEEWNENESTKQYRTAPFKIEQENINVMQISDVTKAEEVSIPGKDNVSTKWQSLNQNAGFKFWILGFVLGFISGFLGGLNGIRSGPILIFFLHYNYPKTTTRANLMLVTAANTLLRLAYYIIDDVTGRSNWFDRNGNWQLYLGVVLAGLIAAPIGVLTAKKVGQAQYLAIIAIALIVSGITNIVKGSLELRS